MFKNMKKILLPCKPKLDKDSMVVIAQRMQCRTIHKRKDC